MAEGVFDRCADMFVRVFRHRFPAVPVASMPSEYYTIVSTLCDSETWGRQVEFRDSSGGHNI